jgi:hypothetical protein
MVHFQKDYVQGILQQKAVHPKLKEFFKRDIREYEGRYSKYDFYDEKAVYELKSRTNKKMQYPTTLLTCNKVTDSGDKSIIFLFNFTDELCYIEYDKALFDTFERKPFSRVKEVRDEKDYYYIPIGELVTIH